MVDDDRDDFLFFKNALYFQVFRTKLERIIDGDMLLDNLNDEKKDLPDVIFLDIKLLGKDGYECLIEIKNSLRLLNIPVVMYSSTYQKDVADMFFELGANFYIKKPCKFRDVKKAIERVLCFVSENKFYSPLRENFLITTEGE